MSRYLSVFIGSSVSADTSFFEVKIPAMAWNAFILRPSHLIIVFFLLQATHARFFESKAAKAARLAEQAKLDERKFYTVFRRWQFDQTGFYTVVSVTIVICIAVGVQFGVWWRRRRESASESSKVDVVIVGNLQPKVGVGWMHLTHFLDMPTVKVRAVVDSQYSNKSSYRPPVSFVDLINSLLDIGIECVGSIGELKNVLYENNNGQRPKSAKLLCIVAGKAEDNPRNFRECINLGATHVYLEPPGAPTSSQLRDMATLAKLRNVQVYMGYQRLCSSYIQNAVEFSRSVPKSHIFFCHNEGYSSTNLAQVVARNPEGMMLSMACQELAVLTTQYKIAAGDVYKFKVNCNRLFSEKAAFMNGNVKIVDLIRVAFKITTKQGKTVSVMTDRCGGLVSFAVVKSHRGEELKRFQSLTEGQVIDCENRLKRDRVLVPNFVVEKDEYVELKGRVLEHIFANSGTEDASQIIPMLTIQDGVDVMMLAEYCSTEIDKLLLLEE